MKVGILNLYYSFNYGAVLQAYALQEVLRSLGTEPEYLNFRPQGEGIIQPKPWYLRMDLLRNRPVMKLMHLRQISQMRRNFELFRSRYLQQSPAFAGADDFRRYASQYDALVVGSDQVWNCSERLVREFFLDFSLDRQKRISYAACFGQPLQLPHVPGIVGPLLRRFDHLSVRNTASQELVRQYADRESLITADPTLLHDFTELLIGENPLGRPYVMVYALDKELAGPGSVLAQIVGKKLGLPVVSVVSRMQVVQGWTFLGADQQLWTVNVPQWLALLRHAAFVCTDSFHGMMFAAKFKRPLIAYHDNAHRAVRLIDAARRYGLEPRLLPAKTEAQVPGLVSSDIDYQPIHDQMLAHARESRAFLQSALHTTTTAPL